MARTKSTPRQFSKIHPLHRRRRRQRVPSRLMGPTDMPAPAGAWRSDSKAVAKVYWPDGTTIEHLNEESPTWTAFDWANMLYPECCGVDRFEHDVSSYAAVLDNVDPADGSALYNVNEWVVLVEDQAVELYREWMRERRPEAECPWRTNVFAWNVHGPVIVMPRACFP